MYYIGGGLGLVLLALRMAVSESSIFASIKSDETIKRGSLTLLFTNRDRVVRFLALVLIGVPYTFSWTTIATFSPEIAQGSSGFVGLSSAVPISLFSIGVVAGDIASCLLSQYMRSRRAILSYFLCAQCACVFGLLHLTFDKTWVFNAWFLPIGFFGGLWAVLVTTASEQYGTNLRTTVTCMIPNFIRGTTVLLSWSFLALKSSVGIMNAVHIMTGALTLIALLGVRTIRESFGIHLTFVEVRGGQRSHDQSVNGLSEESVVKQANSC
jgi:hypothetical protein